MTDKRTLRQYLRQRHEHHEADESEAVMALLAANARFACARTILLYYALPDEVQTQPLLDQLAGAGRTVLLPRVVSDTAMTLHRYTGTADLAPGAFGIMEPQGEPFTDLAAIDVVVVPGMAFDRHGHRLGRGRGYYDRLLPLLPNAYRIGVCFASRLVDEVPTEACDALMDCVVTTQSVCR